jgi:proline iminopeptidase
MKKTLATLAMGAAALTAECPCTFPVTPPTTEGYLQVSDIHSLYYATYGNPDGIPVVVLHGGPGIGCGDYMTAFFDLNLWHVVMFDQRGAVRSTPMGCMEENTSQLLVQDIETLREYLGIDQWAVFGGSWGSILGLLYGETHPESCLGFVLRGVCLGRDQDTDQLMTGMGRFFPEAYQKVVDYIPEEERGNLFEAYYTRIMDPDPTIALPAARTFMVFDTICASAMPMPERVEETLQNDEVTLSCSRAFFFYAKNSFFLEPDQLMKDIAQITHLPAVIVQGRWDAICPPDMAYKVHRAWDGSQLWMIPDGGHTAVEPALACPLALATTQLAHQLNAAKQQESAESQDGDAQQLTHSQAAVR